MVKASFRFLQKEKVADAILFDVAKNAEKGLHRADLGDETFKLDVARQGRGKSRGYRAIFGLRPSHRAVFAYVWPQNEFENINDEYLAALKLVIQAVMNMSGEDLELALETKELREIVQEQTDETNRRKQSKNGESENED